MADFSTSVLVLVDDEKVLLKSEEGKRILDPRRLVTLAKQQKWGE